MDHISLTVAGIPGDHVREMLIAHLFSYGFDSFSEETTTLEAYIDEGLFGPAFLEEVITAFPGGKELKWDWCRVNEKNWNAEWEKDYSPVLVAGRCYVRAPFHGSRNDVDYDIVIAPKMSFGTAHHESTRLMIEALMDCAVEGKNVIDMGCGTAVLAILANKMGAEHVYAIDNNEWAVNNAKENILLNHTTRVEVMAGDAGSLEGLTADLILANINRNVLLDDMKEYTNSLEKGGMLVMSGFLEHDLDLIDKEAAGNGLHLTARKVNEQWVSVTYVKN